jgi:uncharacterized protein YbjT (DUF2867 family)
MVNRTALVFGSTGLIGNLLVEELACSEKYSAIKTFVRQPTGITEPKVEEIVMDFSAPELSSSMITGNDLFICLGTTIKKAGSIANMEKVDRDLPLKIAEIASRNGVRKVAVVSSIGALARSGNYYLRIKGEMEDGILDMNFDNKAIIRPSMLLGERSEKRVGEIVGKVVMKTVSPLLAGKLKKYRAIHGRDVARAMISILQVDKAKKIYESDELQRIANLYQ